MPSHTISAEEFILLHTYNSIPHFTPPPTTTHHPLALFAIFTTGWRTAATRRHHGPIYSYYCCHHHHNHHNHLPFPSSQGPLLEPYSSSCGKALFYPTLSFFPSFLSFFPSSLLSFLLPLFLSFGISRGRLACVFLLFPSSPLFKIRNLCSLGGQKKTFEFI